MPRFQCRCLQIAHERPHIGLYNKLENLVAIKSSSFQRKDELITNPFRLQEPFVFCSNSSQIELQSAELEQHFVKFHNHTV